jgi:hypothetical protein
MSAGSAVDDIIHSCRCAIVICAACYHDSLLQCKQVVGVAELSGADAILRSQISASLWQVAMLELELIAFESRNHLRLCGCHACGICKYSHALKTIVIFIMRDHAIRDAKLEQQSLKEAL